MKKLWDIILIIFGVAMLGAFIAAFPGILWFVLGLITDLMNWIDKLLTGFANFWWDLSWNIKIPICLFLAICVYLFVLRRDKKIKRNKGMVG